MYLYSLQIKGDSKKKKKTYDIWHIVGMPSDLYMAQIESYIYGTCMSQGRNAFRFLYGSN
jgi:hypothetical protein